MGAHRQIGEPEIASCPEGSRARVDVWWYRPFVLDASIAACWAFDDEDHPVSRSALECIRQDEAVAPSLWWFEVRNTLIDGERRGRISQTDTTAFLRELSRFGVAIDRAPQELARREALPLATLNAAVRKAAEAIGIELINAEA